MADIQAQMNIGSYQPAVDEALQQMEADNITTRIWQHDHTVWQPDPTAITNRLGWLDIASRTLAEVEMLNQFAADVRADGLTHVLLLGMGGSSLAPEVFSKVFGPISDGLTLDVLDSTDPGAVLAYEEQIDIASTLFIVATKSGTTVETLSFFKYFYNRAVEVLGEEAAGAHFVAITDAGSNLDQLASEHNFRETFRNDPNIGGRYSALSYFGMVPAALVGVDLPRLLERALATADACKRPGSPAALLGTIMGVLAQAGRDKVTFVTSLAIAPFADWVEQLIAESTGKEGKGIVPIVGEAVGPPDVYGADRVFVYLQLAGDDTYDEAVETLRQAGQPVVHYELADRYDFGEQMFLWELATAVAGHHLNINPFNQPNVESAKRRAREMQDSYHETGELPDPEPTLVDGNLTVYGNVSMVDAQAALREFIGRGQAGDYLSLQAYVQPTPLHEKLLRALQQAMRDTTNLATTFGFGPRFLHSTGQLHKGDDGSGLFIQLTAEAANDVPIPDAPGTEESSMTFGVLKLAQAMGDRQALLDADRRVVRIHIDGSVQDAVSTLLDALR